MIKFLQDEVRSGFYIPTAIKQAWAVQLKILSEIDRICSKYNIKYFADWGTFLGTVRHGGFVPWDDDLDICMIREDYERFIHLAETELPREYSVHNFKTKENHWLFLARVVNTDSICFDKKHLDDNYNFPYIATVDIFVLDYLYNDEAEERKRCDEVKRLIALADGINAGTYSGASQKNLLDEVERKYNLSKGSLFMSSPREVAVSLYSLAEKQMARAPKENAKRIGQIFPWILKGGQGLPREYYDKVVRLPFEFTTMPVTAYYHKALAGRYGEYMRVYKVWGGHDYPYFEGQRANLQAVADFKLPEFTFTPDMLRENQSPPDTRGSLKSMAEECLAELGKMVSKIIEKLSMINDDLDVSDCSDICAGVQDILANCQQLAVDLGTLVEEVKGEKNEGTRAVVEALQNFCDAVYGLYVYIQELTETDKQNYLWQPMDTGENICGLRLTALQESLQTVRENVASNVINKKSVLFVTVGENRWSGFETLYSDEKAKADTDVYVVKLPIMQKDAYGQYTCENSGDWQKFPLELLMPDVIFIQDGYDAENPCLTIPKEYYSEKLQRYTEKLVFVPPFTVNEFGREDTTDWYNMKHYVTIPGVVRADFVFVQSENMRQNYVERLVEFAGEKTREIWEKKIVVKKALKTNLKTEVDCEHERRKRLMYGIGLNELLEYGERVVEKVSGRLDIIKSYTDKLDVIICMYPPDKETWIDACPEISEKIFKKVATAGGFVGVNEKILDGCDAYYGSPTPYAHYFNSKGRPVMLCDYSCDS